MCNPHFTIRSGRMMAAKPLSQHPTAPLTTDRNRRGGHAYTRDHAKFFFYVVSPWCAAACRSSCPHNFNEVDWARISDIFDVTALDLLDFRFGGKKFKIEIDSSIWREGLRIPSCPYWTVNQNLNWDLLSPPNSRDTTLCTTSSQSPPITSTPTEDDFVGPRRSNNSIRWFNPSSLHCETDSDSFNWYSQNRSYYIFIWAEIIVTTNSTSFDNNYEQHVWCRLPSHPRRGRWWRHDEKHKRQNRTVSEFSTTIASSALSIGIGRIGIGSSSRHHHHHAAHHVSQFAILTSSTRRWQTYTCQGIRARGVYCHPYDATTISPISSCLVCRTNA